MQVSVETTSGLERRLIVGVPAARIDSAVDSRLQNAARTVKLDGFLVKSLCVWCVSVLANRSAWKYLAK